MAGNSGSGGKTFLAAGESARPDDIPSVPDNYDAQAILDEFRAYTGEFADALEDWHDIRTAAKSIAVGLVSAGVMAA